MGTHVIAVVGATATGKSGLATELARAVGGEVVNADSMQLYQGMDIGTAKEPEAARRGVPHHLLDIWPVTQTANVADCLSLGEKLAALAPRVALLAMGDGPGRRARGVPGATDPDADRYDDQLTAALAAADSGALASLDPRRDEELFVAGRAAWQVLAGAASRAAFTADLRYAAAPFEVSYYVATWVRAH